MPEISISNQQEHVERVASGLVLGPLAMREFLRSQQENSFNADEEMDNTVMFDMITGRLVFGEIGLQKHFEEGGTLRELRDLRQLASDTTTQFTDGYRFSRGWYNSWTPEDITLYSQWVLNLSGHTGSAKGLRTSIIRNLNNLGVGPSDFTVVRITGHACYRDWHRSLGLKDIDSRSRFDKYSTEYFVDVLQQITDQKQRRPTKKDLWEKIRNENLDIPSPKTFERRIPWSRALELIGFPDIRRWTDEQYRQWGEDFILVNGLRLPNKEAIDYLSMQGYGPSSSILLLRFGGINKFKYQTINHIRETARLIESSIRTKESPIELFIGCHDLPEAIRRYRIHGLLNNLLPNTDVETTIKLSNDTPTGGEFIDVLQSHNDQLDARQIEQESKRAGCFYRYVPRLSVEQSLKVKARRNPNRKLSQAESRLLDVIYRQLDRAGYLSVDMSPRFLDSIRRLEKRLKNPPPNGANDICFGPEK